MKHVRKTDYNVGEGYMNVKGVAKDARPTLVKCVDQVTPLAEEPSPRKDPQAS